eukprot:11148739-Alexandrium_andersonii.AAC.1
MSYHVWPQPCRARNDVARSTNTAVCLLSRRAAGRRRVALRVILWHAAWTRCQARCRLHVACSRS